MIDGQTSQANGSAATEERGTVTTDKETTVMVKVLKMLDDLNAGQRGRILTYVFNRYGTDLPS